MGGVFSHDKKAKPKSLPPNATITPIDRAILDLKNSRDRLAKYRAKLSLDASKLAIRAKELHAEGNTSFSLKLLRLRKYKLQEVDRVEEQLLTVLRMVDTISEKQNEKEVVDAMKKGKVALQVLHDEIGLDTVLDLMDDIRDQDEVEKKISEALGEEGLRSMNEIEDDDVLAELEALELEIQDNAEKSKEKDSEEKMKEMALPEVPSKPLPSVEAPAVDEPEKEKVAIAV